MFVPVFVLLASAISIQKLKAKHDHSTTREDRERVSLTYKCKIA